MKTAAALVIAAAAALQPAAPRRAVHTRRHGFFEDLFGSDDPAKNAAKDEQWRIQQDVLKRRQSKEATNKYFDDVDANRQKAKQEQVTKWAFQRDPTQDSLIGWKKLRDSGEIGDLKTGLGTDGKKREGGLPIPLPSFGLGGEAGVAADTTTATQIKRQQHFCKGSIFRTENHSETKIDNTYTSIASGLCGRFPLFRDLGQKSSTPNRLLV